MTIELSDEQKKKILNSDDVYSVMQEILLREEKIDQEKEYFWMLGLAANSGILYIELVSMGSVKATAVEPMNVYRVAVLKGAVSVILVHNHPSGEVKPSKQDLNLTDRLIQVGRILNIKVIEHLIITPRSYLSFLDTGLLEELEKSLKWVPPYQIIEQIRLEEKKIQKEAVKMAADKALKRGEKEKALEMAQRMVAKGYAIEEIVELSGLSKEEIEKLK